MLGPGNDSGDPDAILVGAYDQFIGTISGPLVGAILMPVEDADGDRGLFFWRYSHSRPAVQMAAISDDPLERLTALGSAFECAALVADQNGLTPVGDL